MNNYSSPINKFSAEQLLECLKSVIDPVSKRDVVTAGLISGVTLRDGRAGFLITIDPNEKQRQMPLKELCERAVLASGQVRDVQAVLTAHNNEPIQPTPNGAYTQPRERAVWNLTPLEHVRRIIAVASGKGGVGKSTVAAHLAMSFAYMGKHVGLLDADIYGPSVPTMFGISGQPEVVGGRMQPIESHGVKCMSMGLIAGDEAAILRGPMISKSLQQMLRMTRWGTANEPMDLLLVDMPPGTGDVHLSLVQQVPLSGAVLVTTPQQIALKDARKCAAMFQKVGVPILGVVENMSYMYTPSGEKIRVFGEGGGAMLAAEYSTSLLAEIPLDSAIGKACDAGETIQDTSSANVFESIARQLLVG